MSASKVFLFVLSGLVFLTASSNLTAGISGFSGFSGFMPSAAAASTREADQLPMSAEEIAARRKAVREETMLPSLTGIRGIAYRVVGFKNYQPLETLMASKLAQLSIKKIPLMKADGVYKDCDAVVQITFTKAGAHTIAELKVTQWAALERDPKNVVRAVTYSDRLYSLGFKPEKAVEELTNEFVLDFLKANQQGFNAGKPDSHNDSKAGAEHASKSSSRKNSKNKGK